MGAGRRLNNSSRNRRLAGGRSSNSNRVFANQFSKQYNNQVARRKAPTIRSRAPRYQNAVDRIQAPVEMPRKSAEVNTGRDFNINRFQQLLSSLKDSKMRQQRQRSEYRKPDYQNAVDRIQAKPDIRSRRDEYQDKIKRLQSRF